MEITEIEIDKTTEGIYYNWELDLSLISDRNAGKSFYPDLEERLVEGPEMVSADDNILPGQQHQQPPEAIIPPRIYMHLMQSLQELPMLSSVTLKCQFMNSGSQL